MKFFRLTLLLLAILLILSSCSSSTSISNDSNSLQTNNEFVGAWYLESTDTVWSFADNGLVNFYYLSTGKLGDCSTGTYSIVASNNKESVLQFTFSSSDEPRKVLYKLSKDTVTFINPDDPTDYTTAQRLSNETSCRTSLEGYWKKVGVDADGGFSTFDCHSINYVVEYVSKFSFYQDGTYTADTCYFNRYERIEESGHRNDGVYAVVHDSRTIIFNNELYCDYKLYDNGLLFLTVSENSTYIYAFNGNL